MIKKSIFFVLFLLIFYCGIVISTLYFLLNTPQGFNVIVNVSQIILSQFDIQITLKNANGILLEYIKFDELNIKYFDSNKKSNNITIKNFDFNWSPDSLYNFDNIYKAYTNNKNSKILIEVNNISANYVILKIAENNDEDNEKFTLPKNIKLPFNLQYKIKNLSIKNLEYNEQKIFNNLQLNSHSDKNFYYLNLQKFNVSNFNTDINLKAKLNQKFPYEFQLNSHIKVKNINDISQKINKQNLIQNDNKNNLNISLNIHGNSQKNHLKIISDGVIVSNSNFDITPFQEPFLTSANVNLQQFNPQLFNTNFPIANINLIAKITPQQIDFTQLQNTKNLALLGEINLQNSTAKPYDKNGIPLSKIISKFSWKNDVLNIYNLEISNNNSKLNINNAKFALKDFTTDVDINLQNINISDFETTLPNTNINGNLQLKGNINKQFITAKLDNIITTNKTNKLPLKFETSLTHNQQQKHIEISKLSLETMYKNIKIFNDTTLKILYKKNLQNFNSKNISINDFEIQNIQSSTRIDENFLNLNGKITTAKNDLNIDLIAHNLRFLQNFNLHLQGKINAKATINGTLQQPIIGGNIAFDELVNDDNLMKIKAANLDFLLGGKLSDTAKLNLKIQAISTHEQPTFLRNFELTLNGTNQNHQLKIYALLPKRQHLNFLLDGKFLQPLNINLFSKQNITLWEGVISQLELNQRTKNSIYSLVKNNHKNTIKITTNDVKIDELGMNFLQKSSAYADKANVPQINLTAINNLNFAYNNNKSLQINSKINGSEVSPLNAEFNLLLNNNFNNITSDVVLDIPNLSWIATLIGDIWNTKGQLNTNISVNGSIDNFDINGKISAKNLLLANSDLNLNLHDGTFDADIDKNTLKINNFVWYSKLSKVSEIPNKLLHIRADNEDFLEKLVEKPGKISITGELQLNTKNSANNAKLNLIIDRFGVAQQSQQWLISSGKTDIILNNNSLQIDGNINIDAAYIVMPEFDSTPSQSSDIVIRQTASNSSNLQNNLQWQPNININLNFGRNFLFSGYSLTTQLFGNIDVSARNSDLPRGKGRIRTLNGVFEAYGQRLKITRGEIIFNNLLTNPDLNIRALRENLAVNAGVFISGDVNSPKITLISEPDVPDAEKLSWLVLGHGAESMSTSDSALLMTAANGLLGDSSGGIISQIKSGIGIDEFAVKKGDLGQNNNRRPSSKIVGSSQDNTATTGNQFLTIGKNFSSNTKIIYEQSLEQADSVVRIFRKFGRNFSVAVTAGSDDALDIFYNLIFGLPPNLFQNQEQNKNKNNEN